MIKNVDNSSILKNAQHLVLPISQLYYTFENENRTVYQHSGSVMNIIMYLDNCKIGSHDSFIRQTERLII